MDEASDETDPNRKRPGLADPGEGQPLCRAGRGSLCYGMAWRMEAIALLRPHSAAVRIALQFIRDVPVGRMAHE